MGMPYKLGMRIRWLMALVGTVACSRAGDTPRGPSETDALWALAPAGTRGALVASPRALALAEHAWGEARQLIAKAPELAGVQETMADMFSALGSDLRATYGFATDKGGALFALKDGMVAVLPVGDRDKFLARVSGVKGAVDRIGGATCKPIDERYACATDERLLAQIGKGEPLVAKLGGLRGDIEIVATELPLGAKTPGTVIAAVTLSRGALIAHGRVTGLPPELLARLGAAARPKLDVDRSSGFGVADLKALFGVTDTTTIVGSFAAPATYSVPTGVLAIEAEQRVADPAPATNFLGHCTDWKQVFEGLETTFEHNVCHLSLSDVHLELDAWFADGRLRVGNKQKRLEGVRGELTPLASELARGSWQLALWGRGTMLATVPTPPPPDAQIAPQAALALRLLMLVDEFGFGAVKDGDAVRFVLGARTIYDNPAGVVAKLLAITTDDLIHGRAGKLAQAIAERAPDAPFAVDHAAGQAGLIVPTAVVGKALSIIIPALMEFRRSADDEPDGPTPERMQRGDGKFTTLVVGQWNDRVVPQWVAAHPKACPKTIAEIEPKFAEQVPADEWGNPFVVTCKGVHITVSSAGPDGKPGTPDDIPPR